MVVVVSDLVVGVIMCRLRFVCVFYLRRMMRFFEMGVVIRFSVWVYDGFMMLLCDIVWKRSVCGLGVRFLVNDLCVENVRLGGFV